MPNINKLFYSWKSFLQQTVCPAKDVYDDLQDAVEYMESKEPPDMKPSEVKTLSDFFSIGSKYLYLWISGFSSAEKMNL